MKWILIIITLSSLLFTLNISFHIYKKEKGMSICLIYIHILFWKIKVKTIDFGKYLKIKVDMYGLKENLLNTLNSLKLVIANNNLIQKYLRHIRIDKATIILRYNTNSPMFYPFITVMNWNIISICKYLLNKYFKKVNNEYYGVMMNDESKKGIDLEIKGKMMLGMILIISILNLTAIIKIIKKEKKNGRSKTNQSAIANSNGFIKRIN